MKKKKTTVKKIYLRNLSYDDYAALDNEKRYELVKEQLELMSPSQSTVYQLVLYELNEHISSN